MYFEIIYFAVISVSYFEWSIGDAVIYAECIITTSRVAEIIADQQILFFCKCVINTDCRISEAVFAAVPIRIKTKFSSDRLFDGKQSPAF